MLALVEPFRRTVRIDRTTSTFLPSYLALGQAVDATNDLMLTTRKFNEIAPEWHPLITHLYVSLLWYMHIFQIMEIDRSLTPDQEECLNNLFEIINPTDILVPGPLVQYFQALSLSPGPLPHQGNVAPKLPSLTTTPANKLVLPASQRRHLPHIPSLIDQLNSISKYSSTTTTTAKEYQASSMIQCFETPISAATTPHAVNLYCGPTYRSHLPLTKDQLERFLAGYPRYRFAQIASVNLTDTEPITWTQFLGLETIDTTNVLSSFWIRRVCATMQIFCTHLEGSTTLSKISLTQEPASQTEVQFTSKSSRMIDDTLTITTEVQDANNAVTTAAHIKRSYITSLESKSRTTNSKLPLASYQLGSLVKANCLTINQADHRSGFNTTNRPYHRSSSHRYDYLDSLQPRIASHFYSGTPLKRFSQA
jgi:hypothetical protein